MKIGDVYFNHKNQITLVITIFDEVDCSWITNQGKVCTDKKSWIEKSCKFLVNYRTWQEAVNSFEFNRYIDFKKEILKLKGQNKKLRQKLNKAKEALKFYADSDCHEDFGRYGLSEVDEDCGEWAQKVLDEIKECGL